MADFRWLEDCFAAVDYFAPAESHFIVAVDCFERADGYEPEEVAVG